MQNGSPRDACSRWFTCGLVKGPQTPHSTFFFSCPISLTLEFGHRQTSEDDRAGLQDWATVTKCVCPQPRMYLDGPGRSAEAGVSWSDIQIAIRLYRSLYLYHARVCDRFCKSEERANNGDVRPTLGSSCDGGCKKKIVEESNDARLYGLMSSDGVCSVAGQGANKPKPILCRLSSRPLSPPSPRPSLSSLSPILPTYPTHPNSSFCSCHPLNSALALLPRHTHKTILLATGKPAWPFIATVPPPPQHGVPPSSPAPSRPSRSQPAAGRSCPR